MKSIASASRKLVTWQQTQPGREWAIGHNARQQVTAITEQPLSGPRRGSGAAHAT